MKKRTESRKPHIVRITVMLNEKTQNKPSPGVLEVLRFVQGDVILLICSNNIPSLISCSVANCGQIIGDTLCSNFQSSSQRQEWPLFRYFYRLCLYFHYWFYCPLSHSAGMILECLCSYTRVFPWVFGQFLKSFGWLIVWGISSDW